MLRSTISIVHLTIVYAFILLLISFGFGAFIFYFSKSHRNWKPILLSNKSLVCFYPPTLAIYTNYSFLHLAPLQLPTPQTIQVSDILNLISRVSTLSLKVAFPTSLPCCFRIASLLLLLKLLDVFHGNSNAVEA